MALASIILATNPVTRTVVRTTTRYVNKDKGVNRNNARKVSELINLRVNPLIPPLTEQQYKNEGERYNQEPAALHAFSDVESNGQSSTPTGRLVILYEPHVMSRCSAHVHDWEPGPEGSGVVISYPKWYDPRKPKTAIPPKCTIHPYDLKMEARWGVLAHAAEINFEAALMGASWGAFQVLGENWRVLGYPSVWHFVVSMYDGGEPAQLNAAIRFLDHKDVLDDMRKQNWGAVIEAWNGSGQVDYYLKLFLARLKVRREQYNVRR